MSLRSYMRQGREVWNNWTLGCRRQSRLEWHERQSARAEVRILKRLMHRHERRQGKIEAKGQEDKHVA